MSASHVVHDRAGELVDQMAANGAVFSFKAAEGALPPSFNYSLPKGGDRWKCRGILTEAKANPQLWSALVAEIGRRCSGGAP